MTAEAFLDAATRIHSEFVELAYTLRLLAEQVPSTAANDDVLSAADVATLAARAGVPLKSLIARIRAARKLTAIRFNPPQPVPSVTGSERAWVNGADQALRTSLPVLAELCDDAVRLCLRGDLHFRIREYADSIDVQCEVIGHNVARAQRFIAPPSSTVDENSAESLDTILRAFQNAYAKASEQTVWLVVTEFEGPAINVNMNALTDRLGMPGMQTHTAIGGFKCPRLNCSFSIELISPGSQESQTAATFKALADRAGAFVAASSSLGSSPGLMSAREVWIDMIHRQLRESPYAIRIGPHVAYQPIQASIATVKALLPQAMDYRTPFPPETFDAAGALAAKLDEPGYEVLWPLCAAAVNSWIESRKKLHSASIDSADCEFTPEIPLPPGRTSERDALLIVTALYRRLLNRCQYPGPDPVRAADTSDLGKWSQWIKSGQLAYYLLLRDHVCRLTSENIADLSRCLEQIAKNARDEQSRNNELKPARRTGKRNTSPGAAQAKIQAELIRHHRYCNGSCSNYVPAGLRELSAQANVAAGSMTNFFNLMFMGDVDAKGGYDRYCWACNDRGRLDCALKMLAGDLTPHILWNPLPDQQSDD